MNNLPTPSIAAATPGPTGAEWWRSAAIYQIYLRSFADSDGDGIGDLPGIAARLPYLARLDVDAVWLCPFYRSPQAHAGYDVADYRAIDPLFGTLEDFDRLLRQAYAAGLRSWLDRGADGFRVDVAHSFVKVPGLPDWERQAAMVGSDDAGVNYGPLWDQDGVQDIYCGWRRILDGYPGQRMMVAEAWVRPDEMHPSDNAKQVMLNNGSSVEL